MASPGYCQEYSLSIEKYKRQTLLAAEGHVIYVYLGKSFKGNIF